MITIAVLLVAIAMIITAGVLFLGIVGMARGGAFNKKWGNRLMRYRVLAQICALILFLIAASIFKSGS